MLRRYAACYHGRPVIPWSESVVARSGAVPQLTTVVARPARGTTPSGCGGTSGRRCHRPRVWWHGQPAVRGLWWHRRVPLPRPSVHCPSYQAPPWARRLPPPLQRNFWPACQIRFLKVQCPQFRRGPALGGLGTLYRFLRYMCSGTSMLPYKVPNDLTLGPSAGRIQNRQQVAGADCGRRQPPPGQG